MQGKQGWNTLADNNATLPSNWEGLRPVCLLHLLLNTWHVSCLNKCNISLFRNTELNQILLRQDKHISFCKSRQEYRRQGICTAILRCILLPKLLSKPEDAHVNRFGDRRGNTKAHEADPHVSAEYEQVKLHESLNSSFRAITFLWLPNKVIDKLQSCSYQLYPFAPICPLAAHLVPLSGHQAVSLYSWGQSTLPLFMAIMLCLWRNKC